MTKKLKWERIDEGTREERKGGERKGRVAIVVLTNFRSHKVKAEKGKCVP